MEWLSQNWIWLVGIGAILMMYRGAKSGRGGCCGGEHGGDQYHEAVAASPKDVANDGAGHHH